MKGCSAFLEMKRCKDWDNEISSWKYLTCSTRFPGAQSASLHPEFRGCWRSVTAAAKGSVTAECLVLVARSCPTLCNPMDCSPPGSSVHGISQARILEWVASFFSRGSSWPRDRTWVSWAAGKLFAVWVTRGAHNFPVTAEADDKCLYCSVAGNALGKCQFVVDTRKTLFKATVTGREIELKFAETKSRKNF